MHVTRSCGLYFTKIDRFSPVSRENLELKKYSTMKWIAQFVWMNFTLKIHHLV